MSRGKARKSSEGFHGSRRPTSGQARRSRHDGLFSTTVVPKDSKREFADVPKLDQLLARNLGCSRAQARRLLGAHPESGLDMAAGCVTALRDARHTTASSCLHAAPLLEELRPVGRLDLDTTGLLLWTTD